MSRKYIKKNGHGCQDILKEISEELKNFALHRSLTNPLKLAKVYRQCQMHLELAHKIN